MGKIIRNGVSYGGSSNAAGNISYDNSTSGLNSTTVQNAITELKRMIGGNNLQQYTTLPAPTSELEGTIVEYVGGTTINYTHGFIYECKEDSSTPGTYIWEAAPVQAETIVIEEVTELPTFDDIKNHLYKVSSNEEDAEITIPSECDTLEELKNYLLNNLPLQIKTDSSVQCELVQKDGEPLRYCTTQGGDSHSLRRIRLTYNPSSEKLSMTIAYDNLSDTFENTEIYRTYYFETVDTDYYLGDETNRCFSKINTSEEVIEGVGRFEKDGQGNILGEYFNKYEDTVDPSTGDVTSARNAATGENSHAEGYGGNTAGGLGSHAEGGFNSIAAGGTFAHAEGYNNSTSGHASHIEGGDNSNIGTFAHVEGNININDMAGFCAHVEGNYNTNVSSVTHTEGEFNVTGNFNLLPADKPVKVVANISEATDENYDYLIYDNTSRKYKKWTYNSSSEQWESSNLQLVPGPSDVHIEGTRNIGSDGHVEGKYNIAKDNTYSHTEGYDNFSKGAIYSHIEGRSNELKASLLESHIEGTENKVQNQIGGSGLLQESHIEGFDNQVITPNTLTHVEGKSNRIQPNNNNIHIEGLDNTINSNNYNVHVEGTSHTLHNWTNAPSTPSAISQASGHIEGYNHQFNITKNTSTIAPVGYHMEGYHNTIKDKNWNGDNAETSHYGSFAHVEGEDCIVGGIACHAEGMGCESYNNSSHAEGYFNKVDGLGSHVEGKSNTLFGHASHLEGESNQILVNTDGQDFDSKHLKCVHIEGYNNTAGSNFIHIEGENNRFPLVPGALRNAHIEGTSHSCQSAVIDAANIHVEGYSNTINHSSVNSHIEGTNNTTYANITHVEGANNTINISALKSHAEGDNNTIYANAECSHAEGSQNIVYGSHAHVGGLNNRGENDNSTTIGQYNLPDSTITARSNLTDRISYVMTNSQYNFETDPTAPDFADVTGSFGPDLHMSIATIDVSDCVDGLNLSLPAGDFFVGPAPEDKDYGVIVLLSGTKTSQKIIETADALGENININITKNMITTTGAISLSINCYIEDDTYPNITISKITKSLFTVGNGTSNLVRSNILFATSNSVTINGDLTVTGSMNTTSPTITATNSYYGGHIRQDGECPFRYRRMLYFGNYTGDENPKIIVDNTDPQNPTPYQPGYYSLELESYVGLPRRIMKMIEDSIYSPDGDFKANMRHIVSYYCALLQHNVKSRIEITSITASSNTFTQDGETYHFPLVNYVILPPWDGSSGTYTGAAILDIVFNNFQA